MRPLLLLPVLLTLAACGDGATEPGPAETPPADTRLEGDSITAGHNAMVFPHGPHHYTCAGERSFDALFPTADSVRVTLDDGRTLALASAITGSGARYSDGATTAWFRGATEGFIEEGDSTTYADCLRTGT